MEIDRATSSSAVPQRGFLKILVMTAILGIILAISIISPYLGICALALLAACLIFGISLRWSMLAFIFVLPFDPQLEVRPGFYLYLDLFFGVPALLYFWKTVFQGRRVDWFSLALGPYVVFAIVSTLGRAENLYWFSGYSVRLMVAVMFAAAVGGVVGAESAALILGASLVPQVTYAMYQFLTRDVGSLYSLIYPHYESPWIDRAYGFFFQPNNFGGYCAAVSVMLLALALRSETHGRRILCYSLGAFGFLGVASSGSRGAWLGAFAGLALLFVLTQARLRVKVALVILIVLGILMAKSLEYAPLARAQVLDALTVEGRSNMYLAGVLLFLQHPVIGIGLTNYQELMPSVVVWEYGPGNAAHNTYIQILSENGVIGFLLFFGPVFYLFYRNLKLARESKTALLSCAGLAVFLVHGLFDFQLTTAPQYLLLFAVLFGLASKCMTGSPAAAETRL